MNFLKENCVVILISVGSKGCARCSRFTFISNTGNGTRPQGNPPRMVFDEHCILRVFAVKLFNQKSISHDSPAERF